MSQTGWYPDPGGQSGMFRYWDGSAWSAELSSSPTAPAPGGAGTEPGGFNPTQPIGTSGGFNPTQPIGQPGGYGPNPFEAPQKPAKRGMSIGLLIGALVLLLLLGVGAFLLLRPGGPLNNPTDGPDGPQSTQQVCPKQAAQVATPAAHPNDGRVHGGRISFPKQGSPWGAVQVDNRVPFGVDVHEQIAEVERNYDGKGGLWVSSLLVAELNAGDGFYGPEEGAKIVARCVIGRFYGDAKVGREDKKNEAMKVDGHDAWLMEMHLTFDIKGLKNKGETAIIVIVDNKDGKASLYYASIPDSEPGHLQTARDLLSQLKIDS